MTNQRLPNALHLSAGGYDLSILEYTRRGMSYTAALPSETG